MRTIFAAALAAAAFATLPSAASATATVAGFDAATLTRCDDCNSSAISLGFTANFFGTSYSDTYVSSNGYVTFGSGQSSFTPTGLGSTYGGLPIIAALFTDLDTRSAPAGTDITYGTGTYGGRNAFGVNYDNVGVFPQSYTALNTFQILLVDRGDVAAGAFDIVLNYDSVTGARNNIASVGYNGAQGGAAGTYYEFPGSLVAGAFYDGQPGSLAANSNVGVAGRYVFNVRGGNVTPAPGAVPEPATWAMMLLGFGALGSVLRRNRTHVARVRFA